MKPAVSIFAAVLVAMTLAMKAGFAQAAPREGAGGLPTVEGPDIIVKNGTHHDVWVSFKDASISLPGPAALALAEWIKRGDKGEYKAGEALQLDRKDRSLTMTFLPKDKPAVTATIEERWIPHLAGAMATGAQNANFPEGESRLPPEVR